MKNILQIISDAGITLTDEQKTAVENGVKENYKTVSDYDKQAKKVSDLTTERDQYKTQYETAAETLKGFDGKDFDAITKERDDWKTRAEQADADFQKKLKEAQ
ncbi:MAG: phage scaffolding protein, partial [Clostridiales bacterium]|nr:phage scaffolding protein [Clostridiales bacterium]